VIQQQENTERVIRIIRHLFSSQTNAYGKEDKIMTNESCNLLIGRGVPHFKLETFEPSNGDFGEFSLATQKAAKKWTILFFYPADFTFV
jgi:hypothetical protein